VPDRESEERVSLARAALAAAKADARARGARPTGRRRSGVGPATQPGQVIEPGSDPLSRDSAGSGRGLGKTPATGAEATSDVAPARLPVARPGFPPQPDRAEPQPLAAAINNLLDAEGWGLAAATGSVFGRWAQIVGSDLAAHTTPESLSDGELIVIAVSTAWATQVRLLAAQLVARLNAELGEGTVRRVKVRGPVTGTRKPGEWRVRGGRGPRDTYG